jgi:hypothetical protein
MPGRGFNFLEYLTSLERMMLAWHDHSFQTFKHPTNLGSAREHFIAEVLSHFLPSSVVVGSGEITDGEERSGQQDIIIYRSDFPVLTGFGSVNTYLIEGVIATIEVKSDLSSGSPNGITSAFGNVASVLSLTNQAIKLSGTDSEFLRLQETLAVKTFVVGYKGWSNTASFVENYANAGNLAGWKVPHVVYQPGGCIIANSIISNLRLSQNSDAASKQSIPLAHVSDHAFAVFFQHLLRAIMSVRVLTTSIPGIDATMLYQLDKYFSLPNTPATPLQLVVKPSDNNPMSTTDLNRLLTSIGMSTFVKYYDQFRNQNISDQDMLNRLPQDYTLKARRTRVSKARRIFRERLELEALNAILRANKVDEETRRLATEILNRQRS